MDTGEADHIAALFARIANQDGLIEETALRSVFIQLEICDADASKLLSNLEKNAHGLVECKKFIDFLYRPSIMNCAGESHCLERMSTKEAAKIPLGAPGDKLRGVSIFYLETKLVDEILGANLQLSANIFQIDKAIIQPKGKHVMCPRDHRLGAAYVDCLNGMDEAHRATIMLSYSWGYAIEDVIESLKGFCARTRKELKRTYLWMCALCINQHRVQEARSRGDVIPFNTFKAEFKDRVNGVKHIVALMTPWRSPRYIQRIWCVFEMFTAVEAHPDVKVDIVMPDRDMKDLRTALIEGAGIDAMWEAMASLQVEEANASVADDKENILKLIREGPGYRQLNNVVAKHLQQWIASCSASFLRDLSKFQGEEMVTICQTIGYLFLKLGQKERGLETFNKALPFARSERSSQGARLITAIGNVKGQMGELDGKMESYKEAQLIFEQTGTIETQGGAELLLNLGWAYQEEEKYTQAIETYMRAKTIHEQMRTTDLGEFAHLMMNIGVAKKATGDLDDALNAFAQAEEIRKKNGTMETPAGSGLLKYIGDTYAQQRNFDAAKKAYTDAKIILEKTGTGQTPGAAAILFSTGELKEIQGDMEGMKKDFVEAWEIREKTATTQTLAGKLLAKKMSHYFDESTLVATTRPGSTQSLMRPFTPSPTNLNRPVSSHGIDPSCAIRQQRLLHAVGRIARLDAASLNDADLCQLESLLNDLEGKPKEIRVFWSNCQTEPLIEERQRWLGSQYNEETMMMKASMPPFNNYYKLTLPNPPTLLQLNVPNFGLKITNAVMGIFKLPQLHILADKLNVAIPKYKLNDFIQGKMFKVHEMITAARARDDYNGSNKVAIDRIELFVKAFEKLSPIDINSAEEWDNFVCSFVLEKKWENLLHFDHLLSNFGYAEKSAAELRQQKYVYPDGEEITFEQHAFRWLCKAMTAYAPQGCLTDVVNLIFAMQDCDSDQIDQMDADEIAQIIEQVQRKIASNEFTGLWIPTHYVMDAESDDMLCWVLLEYLHQKKGSKMELLIQLPTDNSLDDIAARFNRHVNCTVFRDPKAVNGEAIKKAFNIREGRQ